jgi:hypothetical protein
MKLLAAVAVMFAGAVQAADPGKVIRYPTPSGERGF